MKPKLVSPAFRTACLCFVVSVRLASAQSVHQISAIRVGAEGNAVLALTGSPLVALQKSFDLFPIETSADLIVWQRLVTIVRTNVTNEITFVDGKAASAPALFYRTPTNHYSTPFLAPTGPYPVGLLTRMLTDPSRTNRFKVRTNDSFMATFWYPAAVTSGAAPASYMDRALAQRRAYWGAAYTNRVPAYVSHALSEASVFAGSVSFPVIIYSHGLGDLEGRGVRTENSEKAQELASHGYVVISMDHTDTYGTVLPQDRLIVGGNAWSFDFLNDRLKDIAFLLDHIARLNAEDPVFEGRFDLGRIGIMGWSFGGGTAAESCRLDERLKAAVLIDAYLASAPTLLKTGLAKPFLTMNSGVLIGENTTLFNKAGKDAYLLTIKGASHEAFTDNAWIVGSTVATRQKALAMNACLVSFFEKSLRGRDNGLLTNPAAIYPDVTGFRSK